MAKYTTPLLPRINPETTYDLVISFLTPHQTGLSRVNARRRVAWIHTDYTKIWVDAKDELPIWSRYNYIASISKDVTKTFLQTFPTLANMGKIILIENIISPTFVRHRADLEDIESELKRFEGGGKNTFNRKVLQAEKFDKKVSNYPNIKRGWNFFYPGLTKTPYNSLQGGDVFVLPTWREGFGMSVIEAQALGLPVITSDAYGVCDASVPNETGLRCKVNDPESLYTCMKVYYQHPEMRKRHGMAGRKRVEKYFDHNIVTNAWVEFYNNLFTTK